MTAFDHDTYTEYGGELYHSATEASWAAYWDSLDIPYIHWPVTCEMPRGRWYTPDFYLPDTDLIVEIKNGNIEETDAQNIESVGYLTGTSSVIFDGKPRNVAAYFYSPDSSVIDTRNNRYYSTTMVLKRLWISKMMDNFPETRDAAWSPESLFLRPSDRVIQNARQYLRDLHQNRYTLIQK